MTHLFIEKLNEVYLRVYSADFGIEEELSSFLTFEVPGAKFMPKFKAGLFDGKIRLYDRMRKTVYLGLLPYIERFAQNNNYTIEYVNEIVSINNIDYSDIETYTNNLSLYSHGSPICIRDYQLDAIITALTNRRAILLSPTGSGKSLIIYTICRWLLEEEKKIIIVVPTTSLVEQLYSDFQDYSTNNSWSTSTNCQKLYSGFPKTFTNNVLFTTWQSIYKLPKAWFNQFDVIIGDEAHQFKAKSLTSIMDKLTDVSYRIGTTGSLDNKKVHTLVLEGIFGRVYKITSTKQLQDQGTLAKLNITSLILKYPDETRKLYKKATYPEEIEFLITNEKRNRFLCNLSLKCKGNTLLLFNFVEKHGSVLYDMIKEKAKDRSVYFIHGGVDVKERESIRRALASENDAIVVASYGTMSTGINVPTLENIIFTSPSKSVIRVLQSIGRGLRLTSTKTKCNLFDLTDDLHWKNTKNHTLKHGAERYKIYSKEQFKVNIVEVTLN